MFVALEPSKQLSTAALKASDTAGNGRGADQLHAGLRGLRDGWRLHLLGPPRLRGRLYLTRRAVTTAHGSEAVESASAAVGWLGAIRAHRRGCSHHCLVCFLASVMHI